MIKRIVCWFSCGAASAVATKLAIAENAGKLPLVVARCIIAEEHPDNDRFANDCEQWFGIPITNLINKRFNGSIYEVFKARNYISGIGGARCTLDLKKEVRKAFELPTDEHIFGYCAEEQNRFDDFLDANNIRARAPLIDRGLEHQDTLAMISDAGIKLPAMYGLGYKHNNCIGCCKSSGMGYWNKIRNDFPETFQRMANESRRLNVRLINAGTDTNGHTNRIYLDELKPGTGNYAEEPEAQCGIFCEMAKREYA